MEENDNGSFIVFIPSVPTMTVGSLHVVDRNRQVLDGLNEEFTIWQTRAIN